MLATNAMATNINTIPRRKAERQKLLKQFPGLLCAVARKFVGNQRSRYMSKASQVSQVFHGKATSQPVMEAILRELARRQAAERKAALRAESEGAKPLEFEMSDDNRIALDIMEKQLGIAAGKPKCPAKKPKGRAA